MFCTLLFQERVMNSKLNNYFTLKQNFLVTGKTKTARFQDQSKTKTLSIQDQDNFQLVIQCLKTKPLTLRTSLILAMLCLLGNIILPSVSYVMIISIEFYFNNNLVLAMSRLLV